MLVKASGAVPNFIKLVSKNQARLVFYGTSRHAIRTWLNTNGTQKVTCDGTVHVYEGRYEKTKGAKSEMYGGMTVRHHGWGKGSLGTPGMGLGTKLAMKASGAIQIRYFIALVHDSAVRGDAENDKPNIMHHQKACDYRHTWLSAGDYAKRGLTFALIRSA